MDIESIPIGWPNQTKSKLISQNWGPKTKLKVEGSKWKVTQYGGLSCTLTCRRERNVVGSFNRPPSRPRTCGGDTHHRGRTTTRWRIVLASGIQIPATGGGRTRRLNRVWGGKQPGACGTRPQRHRLKNWKNRVNYRCNPGPNSMFLSY